MSMTRQHRTYTTESVVVAFARHGIAISTIARALAVYEAQVESVCRRAIESGEMHIMPPHKPDDIRSAHLAEVVHLREALSDAQSLIAEMRETNVTERLGFAGVAGLTKSESSLVAILVKRGRASKSQIYDAMFGDKHEDEQPEPKIIDVFVSKVRKKLEPHGIKIGTIWGAGYEMKPDDIARMNALAGTVESPSLVPA